jgi:O-antigen/teichoic acid export membrane protein
VKPGIAASTAHPTTWSTLAGRATPEFAKLRQWAGNGILAVLDQGLISGANFVLGVCFARTAGPEPYGAYMLMFAAFLLIANVYQALVLEPASVLVFSLFPDRHDRYLRSVLAMHAAFTLAFLAAGGAAILLAPYCGIHGALSSALAGLVIATPCVLLYWLSRCFAYLEIAPAQAVAGSAVYCLVLAACVVAVWRTVGLSPFLIFSCTAIAALAGSASLLVRRLPWSKAETLEPPLRSVWNRHWNFGRWGLGTVGLSWAQTNSISFISGSLLGLSQVGGLNALVALLLPMIQVLTCASRISLPRVAQIFTLHGVPGIRRPVLRVAAVLLLMTAAYAALITALHMPMFRHMFGERFLAYAWLAPIISVHVVGLAGITACDIAFLSMQIPQASFRIKMLMVIVMIPVNTLLTWRFGLVGAVAGVPVFSALTAVLMAFKLRSVWHNQTVALAQGVRS